MGNSESQRPPQPQPVNPIMNSIYNTSFQMPNFPPPSRNVPQTGTSTRYSLKLDSYLDKSKIVLRNENESFFYIEFIFSSETSCRITVHLFSIEVSEGSDHYMIPVNNHLSSSHSFDFYYGKDQNFSMPVDLKKFFFFRL